MRHVAKEQRFYVSFEEQNFSYHIDYDCLFMKWAGIGGLSAGLMIA
ncbi:hypothetical protein N9Q83_00320 [bacterium]|nr:hypothetical protein [bacterium]